MANPTSDPLPPADLTSEPPASATPVPPAPTVVELAKPKLKDTLDALPLDANLSALIMESYVGEQDEEGRPDGQGGKNEGQGFPSEASRGPGRRMCRRRVSS